MSEDILKVENLSIEFNQYFSLYKMKKIKVVSNLNVSIKKGEILAIIGASGSGKSLLAHSILGILPENALVTGNMYFCGELLDQKRKEELRGKEITFIPQSVNFLDPLMEVGKQVRIGLPKETAIEEQRKLFKNFDLKIEDEKLYPFELSGGMLRRVLFASSIREGIKLVVADEPTPGLHPEVLQKVLDTLKELKKNGTSVILITHDILSAISIADNVIILKDGTNIETTKASNFSGKGENLNHKYSKMLWRSLPENEFFIGGNDGD